MATYYVRTTGSDSNAGTSRGAAWLTVGKALGASGIASGDTVYIGGGIYRETITVAMTSATVNTYVIGDPLGIYTGDAGEVTITNWTTNNFTAASASNLLNLNTRDFLTFKNISFIFGAGSVIIANADSSDITFSKCTFIQPAATNILAVTSSANVALNWTIEDSIIYKGGSNTFLFTLTRPATADFNYNVTIRNNLFIGSSGHSIIFASTGANAFKGGGGNIYNNTQLSSGSLVITNDANISTTIPILVYNNIIQNSNSHNGLAANAAGQIVENYNYMDTSVSNVTAGANSAQAGTLMPFFNIGAEFLNGGALKPFGRPKIGSGWLGHGVQAGGPTLDMFGNTRPNQTTSLIDWRIATAGGAKTLTNSNANWGVNAFKGMSLYLFSGTGSGQIKSIASNTTTVITVDGNWTTNPDNTTIYQIIAGLRVCTGKATSGAATTLTDSNAAWGTNTWKGFTLAIVSGTGSGQTKTITSNTATAITVSTWGTNPDNTSVYEIRKGATVTTVVEGIGSMEGVIEWAYPLKRVQRRKNLNTFKP